MIAVKVAAFTLVACLLVQLLKQFEPSMAVLGALAAVCVVCFWCVEQAAGVYEWVQQIGGLLSMAAFSSMLRCIGIAVIIQLAQAVCSDCGQNALAAATELAGRILILLCAMPLMRSVMSTIMELLQ